MGRGLSGSDEGFPGLIERGHGLDHEEVDAGFGEGCDLLTESFAGFVEAGFAEGFEKNAEGADGAGDEGFACLLFFQVRCRLTGDAYAGDVDLSGTGGEAVAGESEAVGTKGVGFEDLSAALEVFLMDGENEGGVGEVELVVAAVDEDAARVEDGAHGAVAEDGAAGKDVIERSHVKSYANASDEEIESRAAFLGRRAASNEGSALHANSVARLVPEVIKRGTPLCYTLPVSLLI